MLRNILPGVFFLFFTVSLTAQVYSPLKYTPPETRILFVFDASQSMNGYWASDRKINIARKTLVALIDSLEQLTNVQMALRVYGHQSPVPPQVCNDTRLEVPFAPGNAPRIRQELHYINPKGTTPIAYSLQQAGNDFPDNCNNCRNIIILITDGIEACDGDPCAVSYELQKKGIVLKPFIIGIGIGDDYQENFDCIGHYYNATNENSFKEVLGVVISQALNSTTMQVNLLDSKGLPTETNVNMTFYDHFSGKVANNYIHTINHRGNPDTLYLDHLLTYDLRINTIPPVFVDSFRVFVGKHTVVAADCPQGELLINVEGGVQYRNLQCIVRQNGKMESLNYQSLNQPERYLVGKYSLEIPVLPKILIDEVNISQSTTTTITIPNPGILNLSKNSSGYGSIYVRRGNGEEEWVMNINNNLKSESIVLQPGNYRVVFRAQNAKQTLYTINKTVKIRSGSSEVMQLF